VSALSTSYTVSLPTAIRRFALHFVEMCLVMCGGGTMLNIAVFGTAALLGHSNLTAQAPELSILFITVDLTLAMAGYMALRAHPIRHNVEMSGSTLLGGAVFIGALWAGMLPQAALASWLSLFTFMCGPLCLLMFVVMAARFEHYGGRVGAHAAIIRSSRAGEYTCAMHPEVRLLQPGECPICGMRLTARQPLRP